MAKENQKRPDSRSPQSSPQFDPAFDDALLRVARRACRGLTTSQFDRACPETDDLIGTVLLKLCDPKIKAIVEKVWSTPDGDRGGDTGLFRFIRTVAKHTLVDEIRRNEAERRFPEDGDIVSLDEPFILEDGTHGTRADLVPDDDAGQFQAFKASDLREELMGQQFQILEAISDGATQREVARELGISKSALSREYIRAKDKAAKWINSLKSLSAAQCRANISPTFTRRPCYRPNGIAPETLAQWHNALNESIVAFHDESSEWHPPISKQPRERARRECWNGACQNGLAIGPDNLVLPAARSNEAVRFLPAYTGQDNRLCAACEKAEKRATKSVDTKAACLIEHVEPNARAIPSRANLLIRTTTNTQVSFFGGGSLRATSDAEGNIGKAMDHKEAAAIIKEFDIPRTTIARLTKMHLPDLSGWLNGNLDISQEKLERISQTVADVVRVVEQLTAHGIKPDLRDVDNVKHLICVANDREMQLELPIDDQEPPLRMKPIESGTAAD